ADRQREVIGFLSVFRAQNSDQTLASACRRRIHHTNIQGSASTARPFPLDVDVGPMLQPPFSVNGGEVGTVVGVAVACGVGVSVVPSGLPCPGPACPVSLPPLGTARNGKPSRNGRSFTSTPSASRLFGATLKSGPLGSISAL